MPDKPTDVRQDDSNKSQDPEAPKGGEEKRLWWHEFLEPYGHPVTCYFPGSGNEF